MAIKKDEVLIKLKLLLGIADDSKDEILNFLIDDTINLVLGFCRICELPDALSSLVPVMCVDRYRMSQFGKTRADGILKSITQGSRSESYDNPAELFSDNFLNDYKLRLLPFVNRRGYVPSDLDKAECNH